MNFNFLFLLFSHAQLAQIFSNKQDQVQQNVQMIQPNHYIYTYSDNLNDVYKLYRFTNEEIITCFINKVTERVLISFSVQFNYTDANENEIKSCIDFYNSGIFNPFNLNERIFHNNLLSYDKFYDNFQKNMLEQYDDAYIFDDSQLQADHQLIANEVFLDQTQTLNENLDINQYHILSSHNTYLEDTEFFGQSVSERAIVRALYLGFRNLELDLWPVAQPNGSVYDVYVSIQHKFGVLETNKIDLKSTMKIIKDFGFLVDNSPIIISFENHLFTVNEYKYFINAMEESGLTFLMADKLNKENEYQYSNLKNTIILRMNFTKNDVNLEVTPQQENIENSIQNYIYQKEYIQNPLSQFLTGFSYLTNMIDKIFKYSKAEFLAITQNNDQQFWQSQNQKLIYQKPSFPVKDKPSTSGFKGVNALNNNYYTTNEALKYVSMTTDCYTNTNNIIWFSFEENYKFTETKNEIKAIKNDSKCKSMIRIYTAYYRYLSGNYNPLSAISLGVNIIALNQQNIDKGLNDYINFFTTRNGYKQIENDEIYIKKQYKIEIAEIFVPRKSSVQQLEINLYESENNFQSKDQISKQILRFKDGRNTRRIEQQSFKASDRDFFYITVGSKYRYSVMMKDIFVSDEYQIENDEFQIAILRTLKNYYWDGAFIKLRIIDDN